MASHHRFISGYREVPTIAIVVEFTAPRKSDMTLLTQHHSHVNITPPACHYYVLHYAHTSDETILLSDLIPEKRDIL